MQCFCGGKFLTPSRKAAKIFYIRHSIHPYLFSASFASWRDESLTKSREAREAHQDFLYNPKVKIVGIVLPQNKM